LIEGDYAWQKMESEINASRPPPKLQLETLNIRKIEDINVFNIPSFQTNKTAKIYASNAANSSSHFITNQSAFMAIMLQSKVGMLTGKLLGQFSSSPFFRSAELSKLQTMSVLETVVSS
jgi:hypothetical protein